MATETIEIRDERELRNRTIRMTDAEWERLGRIARRNHRTRADEARRAVELHLNREDKMVAES